MTTTEILRAAKAKVQQGWCQGTWAIDAAGNPVQSDSEDACKWCMEAAIDLASGGDIPGNPAYAYMRSAIDQDLVYSWNDTPGRTQADVLAAFDRAIAYAEGFPQ